MQTYDPTTVNVSFLNALITGFGPGTLIKVMRNEDGWTFQPSNSGRGARSRNPNKSGRIEITLLTSSPSNAVLSAFATADELSGEGVGAFFVKDRSTAAGLCQAENAWIIKIPDWERAKEVGEVTWILESDEIEIKHDGVIDA